MHRSFSRMEGFVRANRAPDTSGRGARRNRPSGAATVWAQETGSSLCDASRSAVPAPPRKVPRCAVQSGGWGIGCPGMQAEGEAGWK